MSADSAPSTHAIPFLRGLVQEQNKLGRGEITFDELQELCARALQQANDGNAEAGSEAAAVLAAHIIYRYVQAGLGWHLSQDKRNRLYAVDDIVQILDLFITGP